MRLLPALLALLILAAPPLRAQEAASLVADSVSLNGDSTITAVGNVQILYRGTLLRAERLGYDGATETLTVEGPIVIDDGRGTVVLASSAELSRDLRDGIIRSARVVLRDQLQLASNELRRVGGRYNAMTKVVASSCRVCRANPRPLWEIRARRVLQDEVGGQLDFEQAQIRVAGIPVFYLPRLRLPDPSVDRATGFLTPSIRSTSALGVGLKVPYFVALGDSRDVTVTPYVSTGRTRTVELRYREAFRNGSVRLTGAASRDTIRPGETRGYLFGEGSFALPRGFRLDFSVEQASDRAYLLDYGLSDKDRLDTGFSISRTRRNEYVSGSVFSYRSLRAGDVNDRLPTLVGDFVLHRRFAPAWIGGEGGFRFELHDQRRASASTADSDGDGFPDGRDVARATAVADWRRNWVLPSGIVLSGMAEAAADFYAVQQDPVFPGTILRITPTAAVELRWPWVRARADGAAEVIEPVVQIVYSPNDIKAVPNEDSLSVEFDEGNLFSLNRFPGADAYEAGLRANVGIGYTRFDPSGWSFGVTAGRILRARDLGQFGSASGLGGSGPGGSGPGAKSSDWLLATEFRPADGLRLVNRAVFDDAFSFTRDEFRVVWSGDRSDLAAGYIWQVPNPVENRLTATSELSVDAAWQFGGGWRGRVGTRYDFEAERAARAGFGIEFQSECATLDLSLSRRFTSSTSVDPVTDFNLRVAFTGFGGGNGAPDAGRTCRN